MNVLRGRPLAADLTRSVWEYVYERALAHGDRVAQVDVETKSTLTFRQLVSRSQQVSRCLRGQGLANGDVVAICSENNAEFCWVLLGVLEAGAACMLLNPLYTSGELDHALAISKPKFVLCSSSVIRAKPVEVFTDCNHVKVVFVWGCKSTPISARCKKLEDLLDVENLPVTTHLIAKLDHRITQHKERCNVALILSSSGSTGLPKGVMLTHSSIVAALSTSATYTSVDAIALGLMPFFHAYGLLLILMCLCEGSKVIIMGKFNVDSFIETIHTYKINCLYLVPSLLVLLSKKKAISSMDFKDIQHVWTGAAPVSTKVQHIIHDQLTPSGVLHHSYGLTETTFTMFTAPYQLSKAGSAGCLTQGMECKVIDLISGEAQGPNQEGELCFRGPLIMIGYMGNIDATRENIDDDGWLHSGDLGYYDTDNFFFIVDRLKELIKYQGYQVSPTELEIILLTHKSVQDAAVIGIPHEVYGELPQAHVVKQNGANVTAEEIQKFIASKVSPHKRLHGGVKFVDAIPKTISGKIKRRELQKTV